MLVSNVSPCSVDTSPFSQRRDELNDEEFAYADDFDGVEVVISVVGRDFIRCLGGRVEMRRRQEIDIGGASQTERS